MILINNRSLDSEMYDTVEPSFVQDIRLNNELQFQLT